MRRPLVWILVLAVALRLAFSFGVVRGLQGGHPEREFSDGYREIAVNLLHGQGYRMWASHPPTVVRPPAYPLFLYGVYRVAGESSAAVQTAQALLGALSCWLLYRIGRFVRDERLGLWAAGLGAVHLAAIEYAARFYAENLYLPVFLALAWALCRSAARPTWALGAAAGALWGLSLLTRGTLLAFPPVLAAGLFLFAWWRRREGRPEGPRTNADATRTTRLTGLAGQPGQIGQSGPTGQTGQIGPTKQSGQTGQKGQTEWTGHPGRTTLTAPRPRSTSPLPWLRWTAAAVLAAAVVLAPWAIRNYRLTGSVVLSSAWGWAPFYHGLIAGREMPRWGDLRQADQAANDERHRIVVDRLYGGDPRRAFGSPADAVRHEEVARDLVLAEIRRDPVGFAARGLLGVPFAWFQTLGPGKRLASLAAHLPLMALFALGAAGMARREPGAFARAWPAFCLVLFVNLFQAWVWPLARYLAPAVALSFVWSGHAAESLARGLLPRAAAAGRRASRRTAACA